MKRLNISTLKKEVLPEGYSKDDVICFDCKDKLPKKEKPVEEKSMKKANSSKNEENLKLKKLGGHEKNQGYVKAYLSEIQIEKANVLKKGEKLSLMHLGKLDADKISKYYCPTCKKEFDEVPKIVNATDNVQRFDYICNKCNSRIGFGIDSSIKSPYEEFFNDPDVKELMDLWNIKQKRIRQLLKDANYTLEDGILTRLIFQTGTGQEQKQMRQKVMMEVDRLTDEQNEIMAKRKNLLEKKRQAKQENPVQKSDDDEPIKILKLRYAKGEITKEEFQEMKQELGISTPKNSTVSKSVNSYPPSNSRIEGYVKICLYCEKSNDLGDNLCKKCGRVL